MGFALKSIIQLKMKKTLDYKFIHDEKNILLEWLKLSCFVNFDAFLKKYEELMRKTFRQISDILTLRYEKKTVIELFNFQDELMKYILEEELFAEEDDDFLERDFKKFQSFMKKYLKI